MQFPRTQMFVIILHIILFIPTKPTWVKLRGSYYSYNYVKSQMSLRVMEQKGRAERSIN